MVLYLSDRYGNFVAMNLFANIAMNIQHIAAGIRAWMIFRRASSFSQMASALLVLVFRAFVAGIVGTDKFLVSRVGGENSNLLSRIVSCNQAVTAHCWKDSLADILGSPFGQLLPCCCGLSGIERPLQIYLKSGPYHKSVSTDFSALRVDFPFDSTSLWEWSLNLIHEEDTSMNPPRRILAADCPFHTS